MNKINIFSCLITMLIFCHVHAQTNATDFTETDIDNNTHSFFMDYLDQNKASLIDISATWCGPCWRLHEKHYLEFLQQAFGPNGTDELQVLFFDLDPNTDLDDINGTGDRTLGDWTANVTYPIFNPNQINNSISTTYLNGGYPTLNIVCPQDKKSYNNLIDAWSTYDEILNSFSTCSPLSNSAELSMTFNKEHIQYCGSSIALSAVVYSIGNRPTESFEVVAKDGDGNVIGNAIYTDSINPGEKVTLDLGVYITTQESEVIQYEVISSLADLNSENNIFYQEIERPQIETTQTIHVDITTDEFTEMDINSWSIKDGNGSVVIQGPLLENSTIYNETFELPETGCYFFEIIDMFGDGFGSDASIDITDSDGVVIFDNRRFYAIGTSYFNVLGTSATKESTLENDFVVFPSVITDNYFTIESSNENNALNKVDLIDINGNILSSWNHKELNHAPRRQFRVDNLTAGAYFVTLYSDNSFITKRVIKM